MSDDQKNIDAKCFIKKSHLLEKKLKFLKNIKISAQLQFLKWMQSYINLLQKLSGEIKCGKSA